MWECVRVLEWTANLLCWKFERDWKRHQPETHPLYICLPIFVLLFLLVLQFLAGVCLLSSAAFPRPVFFRTLCVQRILFACRRLLSAPSWPFLSCFSVLYAMFPALLCICLCSACCLLRAMRALPCIFCCVFLAAFVHWLASFQFHFTSSASSSRGLFRQRCRPAYLHQRHHHHHLQFKTFFCVLLSSRRRPPGVPTCCLLSLLSSWASPFIYQCSPSLPRILAVTSIQSFFLLCRRMPPPFTLAMMLNLLCTAMHSEAQLCVQTPKVVMPLVLSAVVYATLWTVSTMAGIAVRPLQKKWRPACSNIQFLCVPYLLFLLPSFSDFIPSYAIHRSKWRNIQ